MTFSAYFPANAAIAVSAVARSGATRFRAVPCAVAASDPHRHSVRRLFERRWPGGFVCPLGGSGRPAAPKSRAHAYVCLDCGRQASIAAGPAMHRSKLPPAALFSAARLMATHSNGMPARQFEDRTRLSPARTHGRRPGSRGDRWPVQTANFARPLPRSIVGLLGPKQANPHDQVTLSRWRSR